MGQNITDLGDLHQTGGELDHGQVPRVSANTHEEPLGVRGEAVGCSLVYLVGHDGGPLVLYHVPGLNPSVCPTSEEQRGSCWAPAAVSQHLGYDSQSGGMIVRVEV